MIISNVRETLLKQDLYGKFQLQEKANFKTAIGNKIAFVQVAVPVALGAICLAALIVYWPKIEELEKQLGIKASPQDIAKAMSDIEHATEPMRQLIASIIDKINIPLNYSNFIKQNIMQLYPDEEAQSIPAVPLVPSSAASSGGFPTPPNGGKNPRDKDSLKARQERAERLKATQTDIKQTTSDQSLNTDAKEVRLTELQEKLDAVNKEIAESDARIALTKSYSTKPASRYQQLQQMKLHFENTLKNFDAHLEKLFGQGAEKMSVAQKETIRKVMQEDLNKVNKELAENHSLYKPQPFGSQGHLRH